MVVAEGEAQQFGEGNGRRGGRSMLLCVQATCCKTMVVSSCQRGCDPEKMIQNKKECINLEEPVFPGRRAAGQAVRM